MILILFFYQLIMRDRLVIVPLFVFFPPFADLCYKFYFLCILFCEKILLMWWKIELFLFLFFMYWRLCDLRFGWEKRESARGLWRNAIW